MVAEAARRAGIRLGRIDWQSGVERMIGTQPVWGGGVSHARAPADDARQVPADSDSLSSAEP